MVSVLASIFTVVLIGYGCWAVILYYMQPAFLYSPVREIPYTPEEIGLEYEEVTFRTADRLRLSGWYVPAEGAELTLLFCHGNGGNMMHRLDSISIFHSLGLNVFIFDYRGYGNSEGKCSEEGTYFDVRGAYRWLKKKKKTSPKDIILFGRSLGGSIATYLATKVKVRALVIESTFTSYVDIGKKFYPYMPVRWFARFNYPTKEYIRKVRCPVMVIHSRSDEVVPFEFGLELYEEAGEPKEFVEIQGGHNDGFLISSEIYKGAWTKWLKLLKQSSKSQVGHRRSS